MTSPATPSCCSEHLGSLYRFAFLMTGTERGASAVVDATLQRAAVQLSQYRRAPQIKYCLFVVARDCCRTLQPELPPVPEPLSAASGSAVLLASAFASLPEPERAALALFSLNIFSCSELAALLKVSTTGAAALLARARALLREQPMISSMHNSTLSAY